MANVTWACFDCRLAARRPWSRHAPATWPQAVGDTAAERVRCARFGQPSHYLGTKVRVPPKRDGRGWQQLSELITRGRIQEAVGQYEAAVRRRHAIEKRIRDLEGRPRSAGRDALLKHLRGQIAEVLSPDQ